MVGPQGLLPPKNRFLELLDMVLFWKSQFSSNIEFLDHIFGDLRQPKCSYWLWGPFWFSENEFWYVKISQISFFVGKPTFWCYSETELSFLRVFFFAWVILPQGLLSPEKNIPGFLRLSNLRKFQFLLFSDRRRRRRRPRRRPWPWPWPNNRKNWLNICEFI